MDTRKGRDPRQSCLDLPLLSFFSLSHHTQPIPPNSMEPPPTSAPHHHHRRPMPARTRPTSPSPETPKHPRARSSGTRRRRQASCCCLAHDISCTPPSLPNPLAAARTACRPPSSRALTLLVHILDAENGGHVPKRARLLFPRASHHPARHRTCNVACTDKSLMYL
jgi:hypothetical protein